ncbi:MAG: hypothetical protein V3R81_10780, partial [Gammaproteobacteria bacterium]
VLASVFYTLTMFCTMSVCLGGQNHICRAFYLSLVMLLLLLPWQIAFASTGLGVICTPSELAKLYTSDTVAGSSESFLYLRFVGCWVLAVMLLLLAQLRSFRWRRTLGREIEQQ